MGKWEKQQDELKEAKERKKTTKEVIAKYFLDISKLVFTAIVLGGFTPMFTDVSINVNWLTIVAGIITTIIFLYHNRNKSRGNRDLQLDFPYYFFPSYLFITQ